MSGQRVCLTYDLDAVSAWLSYDMPGFSSWGVYGAEVATPRLLDLHDRYDVPSTWFVPGHTIESFPEICGDVYDRGHEIQHHGWTHRSPNDFADRAAERADIERGIESIVDLTGERPTGYRTPDGSFSDHTIDLLEELGFEWDSSDGRHDFRPYWLRKDPQPTLEEPYERGPESDLVEVPLVWHRDDWMQLFPVVSGPEWVAYSQESEVFDRWYAEIEWMKGNVDDGVFVLLLHPQCAGRAPFLAQLEAFLATLNEDPEITFTDVSTVANDYRSG